MARTTKKIEFINFKTFSTKEKILLGEKKLNIISLYQNILKEVEFLSLIENFEGVQEVWGNSQLGMIDIPSILGHRFEQIMLNL